MRFNFIIIGCIIIVSLLVLGYLSNDLYRYYNYHRNYDGLYLGSNLSYKQVNDISEDYDKFGDWVCINTRDMNYKDCVDTSIHECAHEVFAEIIESSPDKIQKVMEVLDE